MLIGATYITIHEKHSISKEVLESQLHSTFGNIKAMIANCLGDNDFSVQTKDADEFSPAEELAFLRRIMKVKSKPFRDYYCDAGLRSFAIDPYGSIIPCHFFGWTGRIFYW